MKNFTLSLIFILSSSIAQANECSSWTAVQSVSCVFQGSWAQVWSRSCQPCRVSDSNPVCNLERMCTNENPNELQGSCTTWMPERGTTCVNFENRRYEQKWVRACQTTLPTTKCTDQDPNEVL